MNAGDATELLVRQLPDLAPHGAKGAFVVIEGTDGTGKTTLVSNLARRMSEIGRACVLVKFPGVAVREHHLFQLLAYDRRPDLASPLAVQLLHMADRIQCLTKTVMPALADGNLVIADRYHLASVHSLHAFEVQPISWFSELIRATHPNPDLGIYLTVDPAVGVSRLRERLHDPDGAISVDEYTYRQNLGEALARRAGWKVLDATALSRQEVAGWAAAQLPDLGAERAR